jgi:3'(2'), 5'-bisphosphate nucleotidase
LLDNINLKKIEDIAYLASKDVLRIYEEDFEVEYKEDDSPLTKADTRANEVICENLIRLYPDIPILSEESLHVEYEKRKDWEYFWCIDPIDGTKEFVEKNGQFTINIALIHIDTPVLGVVYAPVIKKMYSAKKGSGAFLNSHPLHVEKNSDDFLVVASKSNLNTKTQDFIDELKTSYPNLKTDSRGSSLKLCMVADGSAQIYPRMAPTSEWDTAAADAIVRETGKMCYIYDEDFSASDYLTKDKRLKPLIYNKENLKNPYFVVI